MGRFSLAGVPGTTDALFERMRLYANALERMSPPVFVGREDDLRTLKAAVELVASSNFFGMTHIVQGVPSAGKSSLCDQFLGAVQGTDVAGKVALCAKMDPSVLDAPPLRSVAAGQLAFKAGEPVQRPSPRADRCVAPDHLHQRPRRPPVAGQRDHRAGLKQPAEKLGRTA